jgi:expansin
VTEIRPRSHRRIGPNPRWLAAGGAVVLAAVVGVALLLQNSGSACASPPATSSHSGKATFYDLDGGIGNCSFPSAPSDDLFVALGPTEYSKAAACGTYLDVTGPKGKVRVKVFDSCPECGTGHLDLSRTAFTRIGNEIDGIIPITYRAVPNARTPGPLSITFTEGTSRYYWAVVIDNTGNPLRSVKTKGPGGSWMTPTRTDYNTWILDRDVGNGPFSVRMTDVYGHSATATNIKLIPGKRQTTTVRLTGAVRHAVQKAPRKKPVRPSSPSSSPSRSAPKLEVTQAAPAVPPAVTDPPVGLAAAAAQSSCR